MGILSSSAASPIWKITNTDTGDELEGDFEAQSVTQEISAVYGESYALNARTPITQFLHGNADVMSFSGRFYFDPAVFKKPGPVSFPGSGIVSKIPVVGGIANQVGSAVAVVSNAVEAVGNLLGGDASENSPVSKLARLSEWTRDIDVKKGRPPIVRFSVGSELEQLSVIESVSNITYDRPMSSGEIRGCTFTVTLREYTPSPAALEQVREKPGESRWHHAKKGEYYELIASREYDSPLLGDIVRARNPDRVIMQTGTIVKFPSFSAIRREFVAPRSIALTGLNTREVSAQHDLRQRVIDRLATPYTTFTIPDGL